MLWLPPLWGQMFRFLRVILCEWLQNLKVLQLLWCSDLIQESATRFILKDVLAIHCLGKSHSTRKPAMVDVPALCVLFLLQPPSLFELSYIPFRGHFTCCNEHSEHEWCHGDILGHKLGNGETPIGSEVLFVGNKGSMRQVVYGSPSAGSCHHFSCQFPMIYQITLFFHSNKTRTLGNNWRSRSVCFRFCSKKWRKLMRKIGWEFSTFLLYWVWQ